MILATAFPLSGVRACKWLCGKGGILGGTSGFLKGSDSCSSSLSASTS